MALKYALGLESGPITSRVGSPPVAFYLLESAMVPDIRRVVQLVPTTTSACLVVLGRMFSGQLPTAVLVTISQGSMNRACFVLRILSTL